MLCCGILQLISPCHCNIAAMFRCTNCVQINEALVARFCRVAGALQLGPGWVGDGETRTENTLRHLERWGHLELETPTSRQHHTYRGPACLQQLLCHLTAITAFMHRTDNTL